MANYWAISIGINQYRHLQPLMHAQNDALSVHKFLTETAGIPTDSCVLLSDLATSVSHQVVYPDKPALSEWIQTITQHIQTDDVLWFFFSGYGVQLEGADYLMPIDGDPGQIKETGLAARDLIETLAQLPTSQALLVLDINRSQGSFAGQTIGQQLIDLAEERQISLLLSCQPEQYSHETFGVRHGLFTAALLEAFRQKCRTLSQIADYVNKRLPELCEHHWRPIQNPVSLIPEAQRAAVVVPEAQVTTDVMAGTVGADTGADVGAGIGADSAFVLPAALPAEPIAESLVESPDKSPAQSPTQSTVLAGSTGTLVGGTLVGGTLVGGTLAGGTSDSQISGLATANGVTSASVPVRNGSQTRADRRNSSAIVPAGQTSLVSPERESSGASMISGARLRNWGLAALALLMLGVLLKQPFVRTAWQSVASRIAAMGDRTSDESTAPAPADSAASPEETASEETAATAENPEAAPAEGSATAPDAETGAAVIATDPSESPTSETTSAEPTSAETTSAEPATPDATTQALLAQASAALAQRQYSETLITLQRVPKGQRDSAFSSILTRARAGVAEAQQYNASVLTDARTSIQPTQASQFADAIAKARLIKPGQPYYDEAQRDIRSWSQIILDIAEGRATSGNLNGAIAAARVMPADSSEFRQKSQERIVFWQQRQRSREVIAAAQEIPRSGQASTYQKGIVKLQEVPIEHPEYETAQRLADEWSDRIFSIAQARAAQSRWGAAIQAAVLVPAGTTAYEPTQAAIKRWQAEE